MTENSENLNDRQNVIHLPVDFTSIAGGKPVHAFAERGGRERTMHSVVSSRVFPEPTVR